MPCIARYLGRSPSSLCVRFREATHVCIPQAHLPWPCVFSRASELPRALFRNRGEEHRWRHSRSRPDWTEEWLAGVGTRGDEEVRLKGVVEEVGRRVVKVIRYGIGGWAASCRAEGREFNTDFGVYVLLCSVSFTRLRSDSIVHTQHTPRQLGKFKLVDFLPKIVLKVESSSAPCNSSTPSLSFSSRLLCFRRTSPCLRLCTSCASATFWFPLSHLRFHILASALGFHKLRRWKSPMRSWLRSPQDLAVQASH
ncbi:hypothetical protein EI94DRAFT_966271 [Lactarius quietus]|nr:hypothetical protein EI94DRAFT_966271 [Lactarius quietus]